MLKTDIRNQLINKLDVILGNKVHRGGKAPTETRAVSPCCIFTDVEVLE